MPRWRNRHTEGLEVVLLLYVRLESSGHRLSEKGGKMVEEEADSCFYETGYVCQ